MRAALILADGESGNDVILHNRKYKYATAICGRQLVAITPQINSDTRWNQWIQGTEADCFTGAAIYRKGGCDVTLHSSVT